MDMAIRSFPLLEPCHEIEVGRLVEVVYLFPHCVLAYEGHA
jgi:hypothetical protein